MERNVKRIFFIENDARYPYLPHYELEDGTILHPFFYYDPYGPTNRMIWLSQDEINKRIKKEASTLDTWLETIRNFKFK